jgi:hypothetical protein
MTREQEINNEFKYAARKEKPEMKIVKDIPDQKDFTKMFWKEMLYIGLAGLAAAIALVVLFYAVIYGENIDNTLPH